ncbi:hypothetical protein LZ32DRAFT_58521 [Colletotrichum eremochloae]|nr:hypothetical protein LZ32DRAFT_58521 [Colletotrichum eremochloae]
MGEKTRHCILLSIASHKHLFLRRWDVVERMEMISPTDTIASSFTARRHSGTDGLLKVTVTRSRCSVFLRWPRPVLDLRCRHAHLSPKGSRVTTTVVNISPRTLSVFQSLSSNVHWFQGAGGEHSLVVDRQANGPSWITSSRGFNGMLTYAFQVSHSEDEAVPRFLLGNDNKRR